MQQVEERIREPRENAATTRNALRVLILKYLIAISPLTSDSRNFDVVLARLCLQTSHLCNQTTAWPKVDCGFCVIRPVSACLSM